MNGSLFLKGDFSAPLSELIYLKNQLLKLENLEKLQMFYQDQNEREMVGISSNSKKILKKRAKYNKINDEIRLKLIDAVEKDGELLKSVRNRFVNFLLTFSNIGSEEIQCELFFSEIDFSNVQERGQGPEKNK